MAGRDRLCAVVPLLLLFSAALFSTADAAPSWGTPFFTADTSDQYIKDVDLVTAVLTIYEDVPIGHKIAGLNITAQPGDTVVVTQVSSEEIQLSFNGTDTDQNVYIESVIDRENSNTGSISAGLRLNGGSTIYLFIDIADVNDNTPAFDDQGSQISLDVDENKVDDSLLTLTATDGDIGATDTLTYSMDTGNYDDTFSLTTMTKDGKPACQLGLLKQLDYEAKPLYKLTITVKDAPDDRGKTLSSSITVFINVQDVGDNPPRWTLPPMATSVDENTAKDTEVFTVQAIDGDTSVDNSVTYSIISQKPDGMVVIDPTSGKVTLTKELDREDPAFDEGGFINIVIQAKEDPKDQPCTDITCVNGTALVTVNDMDDNDPVFEPSSFATEWPENKPGSLNLTVKVTDLDATFEHNAITLTIENDPTGGAFALTSSSGSGQVLAEIRVQDTEYMDFEKEDHREINFTVVAKGNGGASAKTATLPISVKLQDVNDNPPVFNKKSYSESIEEDSDAGELVLTVAATDDDSTDAYGTKSIRYAISGGKSGSLKIDDVTGKVTVAKDGPFDFEAGDKSIEYIITATDSAGSQVGSQSATVTLTITVVDVDDTPPQLSDLPPDTKVVEETPDIPVEVAITASDADEKAVLDYRIDWDQTTATKESRTVVPSEYNYTSLFQIAADPQDDTKAKLSVSKEKGPDREMMDTITLMIVVTDTETKSGDSTDSKPLKVQILDKNDNDPQFEKDTDKRQFNVTENMPKSSIINLPVLATDVDENKTITYSVDGGDGLVDINPNNGQLFVNGAIDREDADTITITVIATDSGVPPRSSTVEITIDVLDQNDNGPVWMESPSDVQGLEVTENMKNALVYTLNATDIDGLPEYNTITYSLSPTGMKNFTVDPQTGELKVKDTLDREVLVDENYGMTIQVYAGDACDENGFCAHKAEGLLRVKVLDVNDCPPVFPKLEGYLVDEMEDTPKDNQLATLQAADADEKDTPASTLTYKLKGITATKSGCKDNIDDVISITTENNQAVIRAGKDLQGCWGNYTITVQATDGEDPHNDGTEQYPVRIRDKNDKPTVTSPENDFAFDLREDAYQGTVIPVPLPDGTALTVKATDPDDPDTNNAKLVYSLLSDSTPDDANDLFYVSSEKGEVMLKNTLDRESANGYLYDLHVEVRDRGDDPLTDSVHIKITISDVDEFAPRFDERYNNGTHFTEENDANADISDVTTKAQDDDETDIIFYFLVGGDRDVFELVDSKAQTPQLRNLKKLNREKKDRYSLILQTTRENKQPPDVNVFNPEDPSQLSLTIIVDDINDMTPSFGNRRFMGGIAAGDQQTTILRLESDDPDLNDPTTFSITSDFTASDPSISNISQPFKLDPSDTSALMLNFDVSEGMDGYFDFEITAEDTAKNRNTTSVRIFIIIEADRVKFVFANQYSFVQAQQEKVADVLTNAFSVDGNSYVANIETVTECKDSPPPCTNMITHFIDDTKPEPVLADVILNLQFQGDVTKNLIDGLGALSLNLTAIGDTSVKPPDDNDTVFQMLLIVVGSVLGGILALTCITSCIHTHKLRRQVKALSINAFGSRESIAHNDLVVPGSNQNAIQGANPLFDPNMDDSRAMEADRESVSSGDSVLIGVEDDPEFASSSRAGPRRPAPAPPAHDNLAYEPDQRDADEHLDSPAVFDEHSNHHMPSFTPDDDEDLGGASPFSGGSGVTQNPLFGAGAGGATQNPLFGAEMTADGDLGGPAGQF